MHVAGTVSAAVDGGAADAVGAIVSRTMWQAQGATGAPQWAVRLATGPTAIPNSGAAYQPASVWGSLSRTQAVGSAPPFRSGLCEHPFVASKGTAHGRFERSIRAGLGAQAESAARKLGRLSLSDPPLVELYAGYEPD